MLFCGLLDRPPPDGFPVVDGHPAGELPPPWPFPAPGLPPLPPPPPLPLLSPLHVPPPPPPLRPPRRARTSGISLIGAFAFGESAVHLTADASAASQTRTKATTFITQQRPLKHLRMRSGPCGEGAACDSGMGQRHLWALDVQHQGGRAVGKARSGEHAAIAEERAVLCAVLSRCPDSLARHEQRGCGQALGARHTARRRLRRAGL